MKQQGKLLEECPPPPSRKKIVWMRAKGNGKWTIATAVAVVVALVSEPAFAQVIGAIGAALVTLASLLGRRG